MKYVAALLAVLLFAGPTSCESPTDPCTDPQMATVEVQKNGSDYLTNRLALYQKQKNADCTLISVREEWLEFETQAVLMSVERWRCRWCGDEGLHPDGDF